MTDQNRPQPVLPSGDELAAALDQATKRGEDMELSPELLELAVGWLNDNRPVKMGPDFERWKAVQWQVSWNDQRAAEAAASRTLQAIKPTNQPEPTADPAEPTTNEPAWEAKPKHQVAVLRTLADLGNDRGPWTVADILKAMPDAGQQVLGKGLAGKALRDLRARDFAEQPAGPTGGCQATTKGLNWLRKL